MNCYNIHEAVYSHNTNERPAIFSDFYLAISGFTSFFQIHFYCIKKYFCTFQLYFWIFFRSYEEIGVITFFSNRIGTVNQLINFLIKFPCMNKILVKMCNDSSARSILYPHNVCVSSGIQNNSFLKYIPVIWKCLLPVQIFLITNINDRKHS